MEAFRSEHGSRNRPVKVACDVFSHCYYGENLEAPQGWRPFSTLDRDSCLPPTSQPGKEPEETAGFGRAVQLGKGKETWEFSNRVPRYPFWCRQLFGYAPRDPGSYQTWTQVVPWATAKRRAKTGASVSLSFLRTAGVAGTSLRTSVPRRQTTPHHTCCPPESGWWLGGGESGFRKQAQSTVSRKPSRLRRLI